MAAERSSGIPAVPNRRGTDDAPATNLGTAAFAFVLILVLVVAPPLHAQSSATLQGRVFDASGAVLRGATIRVRNPSTGFDRSVSTDDEGRYHIGEIPARRMR